MRAEARTKAAHIALRVALSSLSEVVAREAGDNAVEESLPSNRMIVPIQGSLTARSCGDNCPRPSNNNGVNECYGLVTTTMRFLLARMVSPVGSDVRLLRRFAQNRSGAPVKVHGDIAAFGQRFAVGNRPPDEVPAISSGVTQRQRDMA